MTKHFKPMICDVCTNEMNECRDWLYHCRSCGFYRSTLEPGAGRGVEGLETLRRSNFALLCDRIEHRRPLLGCSVLEIGCAEGWFLEEVVSRGAKVRALEPSENHCQIARNKGFDVVASFFPSTQLDGEEFDIIIFNDVFEHIPDIKSALHSCQSMLKLGGLLVLNLPSSDGILYRISRIFSFFGWHLSFERLWQMGLPSPHITYFNPSTLKRFVVEQSNLRYTETFELPAVMQDGLKQRVHLSEPSISSYLIYIILMVGLPIIKLLPSDIIVGIFQKDQDT